MVDAFTILSYAAEAWGKPMGIVAGQINGFAPFDLGDENGQLNYDSFHYSHSRQFRSNIIEERRYWQMVLSEREEN
jgi:hypothetical protein